MLQAFRRIKKYIKIQQQYSRTVSELRKLTDRDLADLGISRSDIERVARQSILKRQLS